MTIFLGPIFGPVIGGLIGSYLGWRCLFWIFGGVGALLAVLSFVFAKETLGSKGQPKKRDLLSGIKVLRHKEILFGMLVHVTAAAGYYITDVSLTFILEQRFGLDMYEIGLSYSAFGAGCIFGNQIGARLGDIFRRGHLQQPIYRLFISVVASPFLALFLILEGYIFDNGDLWFVIFSPFFVGFFFGFPRVHMQLFFVERGKQIAEAEVASSLTGIYLAVMFAIGAAAAQLTVLARETIGNLWYFSAVAACYLLVVTVLVWVVEEKFVRNVLFS
eukprot:Lithocolla_globosa_v1_NODE_2269_length_2079_cov_8.291358.p1 type:complete len:274 gc:universal NODE_2269_length_2079_cov_8.291358:130-951(+)